VYAAILPATACRTQRSGEDQTRGSRLSYNCRAVQEERMERHNLGVIVVLGVAAAAALADNAVSYKSDIEPAFVKVCAECHGGDSPKKGLDLEPGKGYTQLTRNLSQEAPGVALVKPGDPAGSYLWLKLSHTAKEGRGMPRTLFGAKNLPQAQLDLVERWIKDGAQP
jgi:cytochrome c553